MSTPDFAAMVRQAEIDCYRLHELAYGEGACVTCLAAALAAAYQQGLETQVSDDALLKENWRLGELVLKLTRLLGEKELNG